MEKWTKCEDGAPNPGEGLKLRKVPEKARKTSNTPKYEFLACNSNTASKIKEIWLLVS